MGVLILNFNDMTRIIESENIEGNKNLTVKANNGFDFINKVNILCDAFDAKIIAESKI